MDADGNVYVTGQTQSSDFPTINPLQPTWGGNWDAFVAKLSADGSSLVYSTYLGGSGEDRGQGIAADISGNAYATGYTDSSNFPTANALQPTYGGGSFDAFVTKLIPDGSAFIYSTYLGGSNFDVGHGIAADSHGNAYVTGSTLSTNFPTENPIQLTNGGLGDVFISNLSPDGSALIYSTYLGGNGSDAGYRIAADSDGNAYVTGQTLSPNFPTVNPFQPEFGGGFPGDAFVAKISP